MKKRKHTEDQRGSCSRNHGQVFYAHKTSRVNATKVGVLTERAKYVFTWTRAKSSTHRMSLEDVVNEATARALLSCVIKRELDLEVANERLSEDAHAYEL